MQRDKAIDFLKFLAVIFVVNSHMDVCYPERFRFIASGGAIGDALFFFISGYTLFLGRDCDFITWYKRRLARILPSVLVCVVAYSCMYGEGWYVAVGGYWFVRCILLYYVILFLVRRYMLRCLWIPFVVATLFAVAWWFLFEDSHRSIYGGGYFMWSFYFLPMLSGAVVGLNRDKFRFCPSRDFLLLATSIIGFWTTWRYGVCMNGYGWLQLVSVGFLVLSVVFLWMLANSRILIALIESSCGRCMTLVGGLCLEVYLSHRVLLVDWLNGVFPINILVLFVGVISIAYAVRIVVRFLQQTFDESVGYEWRKIFSIER